MQKHVNLVDLVKSFPTNILLQNLASIQKRTSPVKFAHLAEKSGKGSISNLSTKVGGGVEVRPRPRLSRREARSKLRAWDARTDLAELCTIHDASRNFSFRQPSADPSKLLLATDLVFSHSSNKIFGL